MIDTLGARLLTLLDAIQRYKIKVSDAEAIVNILSGNCAFVDKWSDVRNNEAISRVVPTKQAEKTN